MFMYANINSRRTFSLNLAVLSVYGQKLIKVQIKISEYKRTASTRFDEAWLMHNSPTYISRH